MKKYFFHIVSIFLLLLYLSPYFLTNDFKCLVGDNLNQHIGINSIIANNNALFIDSNKEVPYIMGGIKRGYLKSELNFSLLCYKIFSPINAYRVIKILMCLVAFIGMYLLSNKYIFKNQNKSLSLLISLGFSTLPFFPNGFLTIAGQPLLLFCYLNIYRKSDNIFAWLIIGLFPFFSSLVLGNVFFHFFLIIAFTFLFIRNKEVNYRLVAALILFIFISIIAEYRLFQLTFFSEFISSRSEMLRLGTLNFKGVIGTTFLFFIDGHRHFASLHFPFIIALFLISIYYLKLQKSFQIFFFFLLSVILFSVSFENFFYGWEKLNFLKNKNNFINSFTFRFYSVLPFAWYLLLSISVKLIYGSEKFKPYLLAFLFIVIGNNMIGTKNISAENTFYHTYFNANSTTHYSINNFYSPNFINSIKRDLNLNKDDLVISYGFPSIILNYNNISTIGGFLNNFDLKRKKEVRSILINELNKNERFKNWFDNYGIYCEIQSSNLFENQKLQKENNVDLNMEELKKNDCKFIFSNRLIKNINSLPIEIYLKKSNNPDSYLKYIYIYKI